LPRGPENIFCKLAEILTGLAAAGCTLIAFATGRGAPQGFPFVPVVKITGNRVTWDKLRDHMDTYVGTIMEGTENESLRFAVGGVARIYPISSIRKARLDHTVEAKEESHAV
jgi:hypothetical protein